ncbi:hypothetical protein BCR32DRAFT_288893 [Anaeromyces robustus]|uniref:Transmembrane protein n=1 Tax=Anaeromyces robustus TaxID=1754192 RepID=A0A1Y1XQC3_9FUNG|nr:hypothetical protein BCR32DRAFT_288893 [Anaeromyces robustus]|eukprot:ORX87949.1 hypothetical protein BCR32DRAFT_288893 [Anaeromyces robustus]
MVFKNLFKKPKQNQDDKDIICINNYIKEDISSTPPPPYTPVEYKWDTNTLFLGFYLGLEGIKNTLTHTNTRNKLIRDIALFLTVTFIIFISGHLLSIPLHLLKIFKIFGFSNAGFLAERFHKILNWIIKVYPQAVLLIIRYMYPKYLDDLFFESFRGYPIIFNKENIPTPEVLKALGYANELSKCDPGRSYLKLMLNYFKRLSKKLFKGSIIYILISIPVIGGLIMPSMFFMAINQFFSFKISCGVSILTLISPYVKKLITKILFNCIFGVRIMNREVLEPYFCRVKMTPEEKIRWFQTYEPLLFGFMIPFYILFMQPWYGPLFFAFAVGAIPSLLVEIFKYNRPDLNNKKKN